MPHIMTDAKYKDKKLLIVYVILSPISDQCYIGKTEKHAARNHYKNHYILRNNQTKHLFQTAKNVGYVPKMYLLEESETTEIDAYHHCVAWTRYFIEHGYESLSYEKTVQYAMTLNDKTEPIFNAIKDIPIEEILNDERDLFPDYGMNKKTKKDKDLLTISFRIDKKEAEIIRAAARKNHQSIAQYCRAAAVNGCIVDLDLRFLSRYLNELLGTKNLLRQTMYTIYKTGRYYPPDLENIQQLVDVIAEHERKINTDIHKFLKMLRKDIRSARRITFSNNR